MTADAQVVDNKSETHTFQAEVAELLRLMVHSVYSETEIFLRELISNASDACDKLRYESIAKPELLGTAGDLKIRVVPDAKAGTLTITDTGIGMDRQELIDNLGTIARSGTRAFMSKLQEAKDGSGLIGQFGVGFYSAFMVADRIEVVSRRAGADAAWVWRSSGGAGFEVAEADAAQTAAVPRGSAVVLHLKDDAKTYLEAHTLERIIRTYSDHILFPIELVEEEGKEARQVNSASAIWQRSKSELKPEDYKTAYNAIAMAWDEPALTVHYKAEGRQEYAVLLFVPTQRPYDLFDPARKGRVKLYVRRVYITDDADLLPSYLRFAKGVIDSEDLPLNISREMLQNNPQVAQIRKAVTGRLLTEIETLAEKDADKFKVLWKEFGGVIKEGLYEDFERRDQILKLARFDTTKGEARTLKDYVADLRPNQTAIYYLVGETAERLKGSPKLEAARARGIEVLLLTDPVDAFWTSLSLGYEGKPLKSLSQGDVDFGLVPLLDENKPDEEAVKIDEKFVAEAIKAVLGDRVSDVRASQRLTDSACCLVAQGAGPDRELDRLLSRQNRGVGAKPVLEINPRHALVKAASAAKAMGREDDLKDLAELLLDQGHVLDGEVPADPAGFVARLNRLVARGLPAG